MSTLWLKRVDALSSLIPRVVLEHWPRRVGTGSLAIVRPGGLGDLVVLTRAVLGLGLSLNNFQWIVERRNSVWLEYLKIDHLNYDSWQGCLRTPFLQAVDVINTEQYHGLAATFSRWLATKRRRVIGFSSHRRADLQDQSITHTPELKHELEAFTELLKLAINSFQLQPTSSPSPSPSSSPAMDSPARDEAKAVIGLGGSFAADKHLSVTQWLGILHRAAVDHQRLVLLGSERERQLAVQILTAWAAAPIQVQQTGGVAEKPLTTTVENYVGEIPFSETVQHLRTARRFYGVDGGLMHIADFFNTPSSVIFPRDNTTQWRPLTEGSIVWNIDFMERHVGEQRFTPN